jgi:hypothetical protein
MNFDKLHLQKPHELLNFNPLYTKEFFEKIFFFENFVIHF